jgi:E3 ubiquitin-protein ligase SHPRH
MVAREQKGDAMGRGHLHLHPAWLQLLAADGQLLYLHAMPPHQVSVNFHSAPVGGTCGGAPCLPLAALASIALLPRQCGSHT